MLKVKEYLNDEEYDQDPLNYDHENDCPIETDNLIAITPMADGIRKCADAIITNCVKPETVVKRFFKALEPVTNWFGGSEEGILESMESGAASFHDKDCLWSFDVENLDGDKTWYIDIICDNQNA